MPHGCSLLLPDEVPVGERLEIWARLSIDDDLKYLASAELAIDELAPALAANDDATDAETVTPDGGAAAATADISPRAPTWRAASAKTKRRHMLPTSGQSGAWVAAVESDGRPDVRRTRRLPAITAPRVASRAKPFSEKRTVDRDRPNWSPQR